MSGKVDDERAGGALVVVLIGVTLTIVGVVTCVDGSGSPAANYITMGAGAVILVSTALFLIIRAAVRSAAS